MLLSTQTDYVIRVFGMEDGIRMLCEAGYDALDYSFFSTPFHNEENYREIAENNKRIAGEYGVIFNQAHAPFGGGYDNYVENLIPTFPRVFEAAGIMGVRQIVVHPLQKGRYYRHEQELFEMNMEFYSSIAPLAKENGIKIAIENMWQTNPHGRYIVDDVCADPYELLKYYDTLNDPEAFTICLDTGHAALCNREPEDAIRVIGSKLGALHVHDVDYRSDLHTLPGLGKINWSNVTSALHDIGYKGEFTYEADNFLVGFGKEFIPEVVKFMVKRGRHLISFIDY